MAAAEDNSAEEGKKDGEAEVHPWEAVCGRFHPDMVKALGSMVVAYEHPVGQGGGSCVNVVRRLTACVAVEADRMLQALRA